MAFCLSNCAGTAFAQFSTVACPTPTLPRNMCIKHILLISCSITAVSLITATPTALATLLNTAYIAGTVSVIRNVDSFDVKDAQFEDIEFIDCSPTIKRFVAQEVSFREFANENVNAAGTATPHFDQTRNWAIRAKLGKLNFGFVTCSNELFLNLNESAQNNFANATFSVQKKTDSKRVGGVKTCNVYYQWDFVFNQPFLENLPRITDIATIPANPLFNVLLS